MLEKYHKNTIRNYIHGYVGDFVEKPIEEVPRHLRVEITGKITGEHIKQIHRDELRREPLPFLRYIYINT